MKRFVYEEIPYLKRDVIKKPFKFTQTPLKHTRKGNNQIPVCFIIEQLHILNWENFNNVFKIPKITLRFFPLAGRDTRGKHKLLTDLDCVCPPCVLQLSCIVMMQAVVVFMSYFPSSLKTWMEIGKLLIPLRPSSTL